MNPHGTILGTVAELHRYPVKSLAGERPAQLRVDERGVVGDRLWSVRDPDGKLGSGKSSRRFRRMDGLLALSASYEEQYDAAGAPVLTFPDGLILRGDDPAVHDALSAHVGRPVTLAREEQVSHFDEGPVHLVTTAALATTAARHGGPVDARRLRPNFVVDTGSLTGLPEHDWDGRHLALGDEVVIQVQYAMPRCVMLDLPARDLPADRGLLRTVTELSAGDLGVVASVLRGGQVSLGDPVSVLT